MTELRVFKFVTTLALVLEKIKSEDKVKYDTFYSHSKTEAILNKSDIDDNVYKSIYTKVISNIQKFRKRFKLYLNQSILKLYQTYKNLGKGSGWIIDSVLEHNIHISHFKV